MGRAEPTVAGVGIADDGGSHSRPDPAAQAAPWAVPLADVVLDESDLEAVLEAYRSGWLSMGPRTAAFEEAFAAHEGVEHAVAVSSGTAALHLMCLANGLGPGDEVIVPSLTFVATVNAIRYTGATPVFADIASPLAPWLSAAACEPLIGPRTRAILHVPYGGHPGELSALAALTERHDLLLLLDAAHAVGARLHGRPVASFGHAAAFSFFANKNLAIGEGGMLTTDDGGVAQRARLLRSHGMTALSWDRARGHATGYDVVALGHNYRLDEPRAALGSARLPKLEADNARRAALDRRYRRALHGVVDCALAAGPDVEPAFHLFTIVLPEHVDREAFRARLGARRVQTSVHYPPVHRFSIHADDGAALPVTESYAGRTVTLPLFPHLSEDQQDLVVREIATCLNDVERSR
jgi:dTDP-4-amino-4,6-dideoxygalactose transaminase